MTILKMKNSKLEFSRVAFLKMVFKKYLEKRPKCKIATNYHKEDKNMNSGQE